MAATIKSARTALEVLKPQIKNLEGAIALGVLKLFIDQQEKSDEKI